MIPAPDQGQNQGQGSVLISRAEQQMARYRRDKRRWLRSIKAGSLERLGISGTDPLIELMWNNQLNHTAAVAMLELLRDLQADLPEHYTRIEAVLVGIGIREEGGEGADS